MYSVSLFLFLSLSLSIPAYADVIFHDAVAVKDETLTLQAETKGKFLVKGGKIVEFIVDGKSAGRSLSGGDGFAFKEYTPRRTGLHKISVISGEDKDKGVLLSLPKGERIVFVEFGSLFDSLFSEKPMKDSKKVIKALSKRFPVIFLQTGLIDIKAIKKWLEKNEFMLPVLQWKEGMVFEDTTSKGFKIKLIIGSAPVIESAREFKPKAFSFEEMEGVEEVKDWEEIRKKLRLVIK